MNPSRTARVLAPVAAVVLMVSACSSSSTKGSGTASAPKGTTGSTATTPSSSTSSSTAPAATAPTKAALTNIVVQQSDLPAGYVGKAAEPDNDDDSLDAQLTSCTGLTGSPDGDKVATVQSQDFSKGGITISSSATSYKSQSDIDQDVALLKSPKINSCLNQAFKVALAKEVPTGTMLDSVDLKLTPGSSGGPSNVAGLAAGEVTVTANGQTAKIYLGIAFIIGPLLEASLQFVGVGAPLDQSTQATVLTAVAQRAAKP